MPHHNISDHLVVDVKILGLITIKIFLMVNFLKIND